MPVTIAPPPQPEFKSSYYKRYPTTLVASGAGSPEPFTAALWIPGQDALFNLNPLRSKFLKPKSKLVNINYSKKFRLTIQLQNTEDMFGPNGGNMSLETEPFIADRYSGTGNPQGRLLINSFYGPSFRGSGTPNIVWDPVQGRLMEWSSILNPTPNFLTMVCNFWCRVSTIDPVFTVLLIPLEYPY